MIIQEAAYLGTRLAQVRMAMTQVLRDKVPGGVALHVWLADSSTDRLSTPRLLIRGE
jgi:hypothetical protein